MSGSCRKEVRLRSLERKENIKGAGAYLELDASGLGVHFPTSAVVYILCPMEEAWQPDPP